MRGTHHPRTHRFVHKDISFDSSRDSECFVQCKKIQYSTNFSQYFSSKYNNFSEIGGKDIMSRSIAQAYMSC